MQLIVEICENVAFCSVKAFVVNVTDKVKTFHMKNQKRGVM
jgi:hypothetical protein